MANDNNCGVVRHVCRVNESAYVDPSDVARLVKLASLLAWCRVFFGMLSVELFRQGRGGGGGSRREWTVYEMACLVDVFL